MAEGYVFLFNFSQDLIENIIELKEAKLNNLTLQFFIEHVWYNLNKNY